MGLEDQGIYRGLILETGKIIRSRNVVFEEGLGHHMLTDEGEYFVDDNGDVDYELLDETPPITTIPSETIQNSTALPNVVPLLINPRSHTHTSITHLHLKNHLLLRQLRQVLLLLHLPI